MRLNPHYVIWYRNIVVLVVSLIIPLTLLAHWNFSTFSVILRRRRLKNRPSIALAINSLHQTGNGENIEIPTGSYPANAIVAVQVLNSGLHQIMGSRRDSKVDQSKIVLFLTMNVDF